MEKVTMPIEVMTFKESGKYYTSFTIEVRIDTWYNIVEYLRAERSLSATDKMWLFGHNDCHDGCYPTILKD